MSPGHCLTCLVQWYNAGTVCVEIISGGTTDWAKVTYDTTGTDYCLDQVHAYIGDSIPGNNGPSPGQFTNQATLDTSGCIKTYTLNTVLPKTCSASAPYASWCTKLAAHSHVTLTSGTGGQVRQFSGLIWLFLARSWLLMRLVCRHNPLLTFAFTRRLGLLDLMLVAAAGRHIRRLRTYHITRHLTSLNPPTHPILFSCLQFDLQVLCAHKGTRQGAYTCPHKGRLSNVRTFILVLLLLVA